MHFFLNKNECIISNTFTRLRQSIKIETEVVKGQILYLLFCRTALSHSGFSYMSFLALLYELLMFWFYNDACFPRKSSSIEKIWACEVNLDWRKTFHLFQKKLRSLIFPSDTNLHEIVSNPNVMRPIHMLICSFVYDYR